MAVTIQTRRDDSTDWATANPVLALGEIGIETDTNKAKYGDSVTAWNDLDYWLDPDADQIAEAPQDGTAYARKDAGWVSSVETTGNDKITAIEVVAALPGTPDADTLYLIV